MKTEESENINEVVMYVVEDGLDDAALVSW